ncbi:MAG: outer membrane protein assembly factor BamB family protein, partial [Candidatus Latescibacterota bacterium]
MTFTSITSSNPVFTVIPSSLTIPTGSSAEVTVNYSPADNQGYQGFVFLQCDGGISSVSITGGSFGPGALLWKFATGGYVASSPAIGIDGTVYFGSSDYGLYAMNPGNGSVKWKFEAGGSNDDSPAIGSDGTIYFGSFDTYLYALNPNGSEKWRFKTGALIRSTPALAADGTIYFGSHDKNIYAINPDGTEKWRFLTGDVVWSSPVVGIDGTIYCGSFDKNIYAFHPDGFLKWKFETGGGIQWSSLAINIDGTIFTGSSDGKFYALRPDGSLKWSFPTGGEINSSPAIGTDGSIYFGSRDTYLYALDPYGIMKWRFQINNNSMGCSPTIGTDGTIYIGSSDSFFYAINPNNTLKWQYKTNGHILTTCSAINNEGILYFGSMDGCLHAVESGTGVGRAHTLWPKFQYNSLNTGRFSAGAESYILSQHVLRFTGVQPGSSGTQTFTVTNTGSSDLTFTSITSNNPMFSVNRSSLSISSGSSVEVSVTFSPTDDQEYQGFISLQSAGGAGTVLVNNSSSKYGLQLTSSTYDKWSTDWSPDGKWIAYAEKNTLNLYDIWRISPSGGAPVCLTENVSGSCFFPRHSIDSQYIYFTHIENQQDKQTWKIGKIDVNTKEYTVFKTNAANVCISHNGRYFAYRAADTSELILFDSLLSTYRSFGGGDGAYGVSCFSPNNQFIITTQGSNLYKISIQTGVSVNITPSISPAWYPDCIGGSNWIIFSILRSKVMAYNLNTNESQELFPGIPDVYWCGSPSPDMKQVCYLRNIGGIYQLYVADFPFPSQIERLALQAPADAEILKGGTQYSICWYSNQISNVRVQFSADGGASWTVINHNATASQGSCDWLVPEIKSSNCFIRISDASDPNVYCQNQSPFTIFTLTPEYGIPLTSTGVKKWFTDWSSDGKWISHSRYGLNNRQDIMVIPSTGGDSVCMTMDLAGTCYFPFFSHDSSGICFDQRISGYENTMLSKVDLYTNQYSVIQPQAVHGAWSHDGRYLAYREAMTGNLYVLNTADNTKILLQDVSSEIQLL